MAISKLSNLSEVQNPDRTLPRNFAGSALSFVLVRLVSYWRLAPARMLSSWHRHRQPCLDGVTWSARRAPVL